MKYVIDESTLTGIGDAIRTKDGSADLIPVIDIASKILNIPSGGLPEWMEMGEFTLEANATEYSVVNPRGEVPAWVCCFANDFYFIKPYMQKMNCGWFDSNKNIMFGNLYNNNNGVIGSMNITYPAISEISAERITFKTRGGNYVFPAGFTYTYMFIYGR